MSSNQSKLEALRGQINLECVGNMSIFWKQGTHSIENLFSKQFVFINLFSKWVPSLQSACSTLKVGQFTSQNILCSSRFCHSQLSIPKDASHFTYNVIHTDSVYLWSIALNMNHLKVMNALHCSHRKKDHHWIKESQSFLELTLSWQTSHWIFVQSNLHKYLDS